METLGERGGGPGSNISPSHKVTDNLGMEWGRQEELEFGG